MIDCCRCDLYVAVGEGGKTALAIIGSAHVSPVMVKGPDYTARHTSLALGLSGALSGSLPRSPLLQASILLSARPRSSSQYQPTPRQRRALLMLPAADAQLALAFCRNEHHELGHVVGLLGETTKDSQHQLAVGCGCVSPRSLSDLKAAPAAPTTTKRIEQVPGGSRQPIELADNQRIAISKGTHCLCQCQKSSHCRP